MKTNKRQMQAIITGAIAGIVIYIFSKWMVNRKRKLLRQKAGRFNAGSSKTEYAYEYTL